MILAGDIGGTSTRLALLEVIDGRLILVVEQKYSSREHQNLDDIVRRSRMVNVGQAPRQNPLSEAQRGCHD